MDKKEKWGEWKEAAEQKLASLKETIQDIAEHYSASPESIAEMMAFSAKFYQYSLRNTELINNQNPYATYVQSFAAWKEMGANINKGEHGISILVPVKITYLKIPLSDLTPSQIAYFNSSNHDPAANEALIKLSFATKAQQMQYRNGIIEGVSRIGYKVGTVFDISQTDYPKEKYPELYNMGYSSDMHKYIIEGLTNYYEGLGNTVEIAPVDSITLKGFYEFATKKIVLNSLMEDTQMLSTLTHELGHFLYDHGNAGRNEPSAKKEFEADCISIILQSYYGIELIDSRKKHLADHFKAFKNYIQDRAASGEQASIKIDEEIESIMTSAMQIFRENIKAIDFYVKKAIYDNTATIEDKLMTENIAPTVCYEVVEYSSKPVAGNIIEASTPDEALKTYEHFKKDEETSPGINIKICYNKIAGLERIVPIIRDDKLILSGLDTDETDLINDIKDNVTNLITYVSDNTDYAIIGDTDISTYSAVC